MLTPQVPYELFGALLEKIPDIHTVQPHPERDVLCLHAVPRSISTASVELNELAMLLNMPPITGNGAPDGPYYKGNWISLVCFIKRVLLTTIATRPSCDLQHVLLDEMFQCNGRNTGELNRVIDFVVLRYPHFFMWIANGGFALAKPNARAVVYILMVDQFTRIIVSLRDVYLFLNKTSPLLIQVSDESVLHAKTTAAISLLRYCPLLSNTGTNGNEMCIPGEMAHEITWFHLSSSDCDACYMSIQQRGNRIYSTHLGDFKSLHHMFAMDVMRAFGTSVTDSYVNLLRKIYRDDELGCAESHPYQMGYDLLKVFPIHVSEAVWLSRSCHVSERALFTSAVSCRSGSLTWSDVDSEVTPSEPKTPVLGHIQPSVTVNYIPELKELPEGKMLKVPIQDRIPRQNPRPVFDGQILLFY